MSDITWFLQLINVGGQILQGGPPGLFISVAKQYISEAITLDMRPKQILSSLLDSGIDFGYREMQTMIREMSTLAYSREKSLDASNDRIFPKSWMADAQLPSHANYLVTLKVNVYNPATQEWDEQYRSIYSDDRLSPDDWYEQFMTGQSTAYQPVQSDYQLLGVESVTHNHGFSW
jgi:hypothetical protein